MKKLAVSSIMAMQWVCLLVYFWRMSNDTPTQTYWNNYHWTVFYDSSLMMPLTLFCLVFALTGEFERSIFDKQFLTINAIFTFGLNVAVIMQGYNIIEHTYGFQVAIVAMIITTIFIITSAARHGYFKQN